MDNERQKKIEAGKKVVELKRKRKNSKQKGKLKISNSSSPVECSNSSVSNEPEASDSSSNTSINNLKDLEIPTSKSEADTMTSSESALLISEDMSDDADPLLDDKQHALISCLEQKLVKYQNAAKQKDVIIQKLTQQLASSMSAVESSELSRTEGEEKLRTEINMLHLQMKEATGMIVKQNSKIESKELVQVIDCDKTSRISEIGIQVEIKNHETNSDQQDSAVQTLHISQLVNSTYSNFSEDSIKNQRNYIGDSLLISDRINSLNIITRLIESHVYNSSQSINESGDFSPSKFQRLYMKRLNSSEANQNTLESFEIESQATDINYVDVENGSSVKSRLDYPPVEKMRSHLVPKDVADIADFLMSEMNHINLSLQSLRSGPEGDCDAVALLESMGPSAVSEASLIEKSNVGCGLQEILQQKSKLESKIIQLKQMDKEMQLQQRSRQKSIESDTLTAFEDNLIMEEPPLSCVSLLSLTDSEYRTECMTTDSEANFSRKVSLDSSRLIQEGDFCPNCDKCYELVKEKYDDHMCLLKEALENSINNEKSEIIKRLELEIQKLKTEKSSMQSDMEKQVELLCQEQELKIQHILDDQHKKLVECQSSQEEWTAEKQNLVSKVSNLEGELSQLKINLQDAWNEKTNIEISLQKQIADLVEEHQEDLEAQKLSSSELFSQEKHKREAEYLSSLEILKKLHKEEVENIQESFKKQLSDQESSLKTEHSSAIALLKSDHLEECAAFQNRIDQLLEQKCELYSKTTQEYEAILKRNHKVLVNLCNQLRCKLYNKKKKIAEDSCKSINGDLDVTLSDTLDEVNKNIEEGIFKFLDQSYFSANDQLEIFEETQYLSLEVLPSEDIHRRNKKELKEKCIGTEQKQCTSVTSKIGESEESLNPEYMQLLQEEVMKVQADFQNDVALYIDINEKLHKDIKTLQKQNQELIDHNKKMESQLSEKENESQMNAMGSRSVKSSLAGSQISSSDFRSWHDVAQTNSRLLHVLSDLVKTFLDIEQEINRHLYEHGLVPSRSTALGHHEDETGHSVGSREDFASLSFGECPNLELAEDGPDLTPRAWDLFSVVGSYDNEMEGEDVVLGASRRLRAAVDHLLNLLTRALDNQQNQDLKLLLKRNEELSQELNEESKCRDQVHMELVTAESTIRKLESEKQNLCDIITDLRDNNDALKREIMIEKNKVNYFNQEKEAANDEIQTLKNQCELLASRLGDPEKMSTNKTLSSSVTIHENKELLQENSRLSSEKHNVEISLSMERQSFLDRMQQMEISLENLNAEKDDLMENKCKEIRDLKAEMEAMEKQLQSNKKFIEEQAQEREQEREEYLKELSKMREHVREKEKIQSNEAQLRKEIESLEQDLRLRIEDHQNTMQKKDAIEVDLRQYVDKVNDLRDIIAEFEKELQMKSKIEIELRQRLSSLTDTVNDQERRNSLLGDEIALSKTTKVTGVESTEQVQTLKEKLAFQSQEIEEMSQNQTLLQELRGQIHFLEAKVEQRAKQLEALHLSSNSPFQSADASPSSQDSESIHLPCEDGWEMSPRSIHWLEMRRLEEKIGRLVHIDEELVKKNKDLEQRLKQLQNIHSECEQENSILQEKLTEQMIQVSTLKSHMDEQKHKPPSPLKNANISKKLEDLQEAYQAVADKNRELYAELNDAKAVCQMLQEEIAKKDNQIASFQLNMDSALKEKENLQSETSCFKLLLLEKQEDLSLKSEMIESLQKELLELQNNKINAPEIQEEMVKKDKEMELLKKENAELRSLAEKLKEEIISLKEALENSKKELDIEKVQIETLYDELASVSEDNKRLEEDLETVQNMMQQKERELATLHEETDAEIKLQAEFETLEKQFESQRAVEQKLRQRIQELEESLETMRSNSDQFESHKNKLEKSHQMEIESLKGQLNALKKCISSEASEDIDLTMVKKEIVEAAKTFNLKNSAEKKDYEGLVYKLLKKSVDNQLQKLQRKFEVDIDNINISWRHKIESEIGSMSTLCEKYKKDYLLLQEQTSAEADKICKDRDSFWQSKLEEIENSLKKEISEKHSKELSFLRTNFEKLASEKTVCEKEVKLLSQQVEELKFQKEKIFKEFQERLPLLEHKLKERLENKWKQKETDLRQEVQLLQKKLDSALQRETAGQLRHKDEIAELHRIFEARWREEVKKIINLQAEELQKLKNNKEKNLEEVNQHLVAEYGKKLEAFQKEYAKQIMEERKLFETRHQNNLMEIHNTLEKRFEEEKRVLLNAKDRELAALTEALEERKREIADLKCLIQNSDKRYWEEEKQSLISRHEKEISELKQKLKTKYEKLLQNHLQARDDDMKKMEEAYNQRLEEVSDLMKIAKQAATGSLHAESGSLRTSTPPSEITSSDEACSSCQEDMLLGNKHLLANKLHQGGKRLLNIINSTPVTSNAEKEYAKWLEEREWIIEKLKHFNNDMVNGQMNVKSMINNICSELYESRKKNDVYAEEIHTLKRKYSQLEGQINEADSKLYILATNLSHQAKLNAELDSLLSSKTDEVDELKRTLKESGFTTSKSSLQQYSRQYSTPTSSSCTMEQLRSADIISRPADKFAAFLPEIDSPSPMKLNKTNEELYPESVKSLIELTDEILKFPDSSMKQEYDHQSININQEQFMGENEISSNFYAKIHGLYWVYRKSLSQNRSLKYQKKYLLMLIRGFQVTEKVTLSCVNQIGKDIVCETGSCNSSVSERQPLRGCKLFRTVAFVIVAIQRMKFYVRRWRLFAKVPETEIINAEVQSVFHNYHYYSPTTMFCSFNSSLLSLSSKSTSVYENEQMHNVFNSSASSISSRTGTKSKRRPKFSQSTLSEYVQRLDNLQKQLGLNNQR